MRPLARDRAAYLEHLAVEVLVELSMRYGATGRPEHLYALPRWRRADQAIS
jgi:response regulator of citrate/malate metabolism